MNITVLVPTYCRPEDLARCLQALKHQVRLANEVIVVIRDTDAETQTFLKAFDPSMLPLTPVIVTQAGVIAAMNAGLEVAQGDIVAITDDDAAPQSDWLSQIEAHFLADDRVGAVGGRDLIHQTSRPWKNTSEIVGRVQWHGRVIGNHHIGVGEARPVDVIKGVNSSYRRSAIKNLWFDERLQGTGAQVYYELAFNLSLKRAGWIVLYDPNIVVDHYPSERFDEDQRHKLSQIAAINAAHNETLALLEYLSPLRRTVFLLWTVVIGTRANPGFLQLLRLLPGDGQLAVKKWLASMRGRWQGWRTWQRTSKKFNGFGS